MAASPGALISVNKWQEKTTDGIFSSNLALALSSLCGPLRLIAAERNTHDQQPSTLVFLTEKPKTDDPADVCYHSDSKIGRYLADDHYDLFWAIVGRNSIAIVRSAHELLEKAFHWIKTADSTDGSVSHRQLAISDVVICRLNQKRRGITTAEYIVRTANVARRADGGDDLPLIDVRASVGDNSHIPHLPPLLPPYFRAVVVGFGPLRVFALDYGFTRRLTISDVVSVPAGRSADERVGECDDNAGNGGNSGIGAPMPGKEFVHSPPGVSLVALKRDSTPAPGDGAPTGSKSEVDHEAGAVVAEPAMVAEPEAFTFEATPPPPLEHPSIDDDAALSLSDPIVSSQAFVWPTSVEVLDVEVPPTTEPVYVCLEEEEEQRQLQQRLHYVYEEVVPETENTKFRTEQSVDRMETNCDKSLPLDIVAFLNRQIDGRIFFGIYGIPNRRVRGIKIAATATTDDSPRRLEKRLRDALAVNLGTDQHREILASIQFRFVRVVEPEGSAREDDAGRRGVGRDEDAEICDRYVVIVDVRGKGNDRVFRVKNCYPWWENGDSLSHRRPHFIQLARDEIKKKSQFVEARNLLSRVTSRAFDDSPNPANDPPSLRVLKEDVVYDSGFVLGELCPFPEESQTVQLHPEVFPLNLSVNEFAVNIAAMFNSGTGGSIYFGFFLSNVYSSSPSMRVNGVKISASCLSTLKSSVSAAADSFIPHPRFNFMRLLFHVVHKPVDEHDRVEGSLSDDRYIVEIRVSPQCNTSNQTPTTPLPRETFLPPPLSARIWVTTTFRPGPEVKIGGGLVGKDVRTGKMIGQKTFYLRTGATVGQISADDIRRIALRETIEQWRILLR